MFIYKTTWIYINLFNSILIKRTISSGDYKQGMYVCFNCNKVGDFKAECPCWHHHVRCRLQHLQFWWSTVSIRSSWGSEGQGLGLSSYSWGSHAMPDVLFLLVCIYLSFMLIIRYRILIFMSVIRYIPSSLFHTCVCIV